MFAMSDISGTGESRDRDEYSVVGTRDPKDWSNANNHK